MTVPFVAPLIELGRGKRLASAVAATDVVVLAIDAAVSGSSLRHRTATPAGGQLTALMRGNTRSSA